jgi:hypothetical protein
MRLRVLLGVVSVIGLLVTEAVAQTGSITGQVLDTSGAVIANAQITATAPATGITRTVSSSSAGIYNFAALPPAVYNVSATASGFQEETRKSVILNIAATLPINFTLGVSGGNTTVDVQEVTTAPVETDSFQLSTVIDSKQILSLPLILRDPYQLVLLSPGVVNSLNNDGGFAVNGQRDRNNNFLLDGADNNDTSVPGTSQGITSANPDSTQEFRVITNGFDAEFGRNTGAIIDVITRSGSNQFHGDVYWFGRYNALGARDFFNTKANGPQDPYVRNDVGASVGGPIWKDHTFFFLNAEIQRFQTTRTASTVTPTAAFRTGVFNYVGSDGTVTPVNLTNPANPNNLSGLPLDPTIQKIFAITPVGQQDLGDGASTIYNFPSPDSLNNYALTGRFDHKLTNKHQLTIRYNYFHSAESDPFHDESLPGYGNTTVLDTAHNGVISIASALSSSTTNLFRASYNQNNNGFFCNHAAFDALLGVDNFGNGFDVNVPGFFNGNNFGCWDLGDSNGQARLSSTLLFGDTFTVTKGRHTIKFGGEFRNVKDTSYDNFFSRASLALDNYFNFNTPAYTFNGSPNDIETFEDYIWGAQGSVANLSEYQFFTADGTRRSTDLTRFVQREWATFAQDTLKVTPRFTLIAGLRYAFNGVPFERDANFSNFYGDASAVTPPGGFVFTQVGPGTGHQLFKNNWNMWEPRVGFAYDVNGDGKTAIRGGFGIFHDRIFDNLFGNAKSNPPFQASLNALYPPGAPGSFTVSNVQLPGNLTPSASITDGDFLEPVVIDPNLKMPTSYSWNIGVQRQINARLTGELNYVGSHSLHALREIDGAPPQPNLVQAEIAAGIDPSALTTTNLYTGGTDVNGNSFNPAVNNNAFFHELFQTSIVDGNYNSLQATVKGQYSGAVITASYTYAHSLDNGSDPLTPGAGNSGLPRNTFDLGPEYGNSDFDVRHRATVAVVYDLPVGIGAAHLNHGFVGHLLEGIQISGIETAQTGEPFDLRGTVDNLHTGVNNRPEEIGPAYPSGRGSKVSGGVLVGPNVASFTNAPFDENVAIHRNKFFGPGYVDTDAVFQKTQTIFEQAKLVFRVESYNLLNHPNFVTPGNSGLSTGTITLGSPLFGLTTAQVGQNDGTTGARQIQAALKLIF